MNTIYILLGANLGNSLQQILDAEQKLITKIGNLMSKSSLYKSAAWGVEDQPPFLNQVLILNTTLDAHTCLTICQEIEHELGRVRLVKWGARVIDIDILYFNNDIISTPNLIIPHPYIAERKFTLEPLAEIAPTFIHPFFNKSQEELLRDCTDPLDVQKIS